MRIEGVRVDSWWNSDGFTWSALLVSALVLGGTFGLVGGLAARAGHLGWAQAAVVAFAPLALYIPALLCGRWNVYDTTPLNSGAVVMHVGNGGGSRAWQGLLGRLPDWGIGPPRSTGVRKGSSYGARAEAIAVEDLGRGLVRRWDSS